MKSHLSRFFVLTVVIGALLRVIWGSDIEYKYDEHFMFERTQRVGIEEPFPWIGMASGVGTRNPGMSIWVFLGLSKLFFAQTPPELARGVEIFSIFALLSLVVFSFKTFNKKEREEWLWAAALVSVNPLSIILERKIWAQSVLPIFSVFLILGWFKRDKKWGAFLWGLIGMWIGQIHMSGFFFMGALFLWTLFFGRKLKVKHRIQWPTFWAGSIIGSLTLIPWLDYILFSESPGGKSFINSVFKYVMSLDYKPLISSCFWQLWVTDALGLGVWYSLGVNEFRKFLTYPLIFNEPTYLIALVHLIIVCSMIWVLLRTVRALWLKPDTWKSSLLGLRSDGDFLRSAGMWGFGILLSLLGVVIYRHYLIVAYPLEALWLAQITLRHVKKPMRLLGLLWVCQLLISSIFLYYIHTNQGAPTGDYGVGYQFQSR